MNITSGSNPSINGEYFYIRNLQGDIIGLIDKNGTEVVSYTYDTWGKPISIEGSLKDTVGVKNPYRYRGYRYDSETGLYYLNARYYNPEWGRFINADGIIGNPGELLSANMFAYCGNDPVNREDSNGYLWGFIKAFVSQIANAINVLRPVYAVAGGAALLPIGDLIGLAVASVATIAVVGIATYNSITYSSKSNSDDTKPANPSENKSNGKAKNKLKPNIDAKGDHTTFKRNPETGEVTNYEIWKANPQNPKTGSDSQKRYDGTGKPHFNKVTKETLIPHVHDKTAPGGVRGPIPWEIPIRR